MIVYHESKLSRQIESGANGIDNLDYKYLTEDLTVLNKEQLSTVKKWFMH